MKIKDLWNKLPSMTLKQKLLLTIAIFLLLTAMPFLISDLSVIIKYYGFLALLLAYAIIVVYSSSSYFELKFKNLGAAHEVSVTLEERSPNYSKWSLLNEHDDISVLTYRRLRLRHEQVDKVYAEARELLKGAFPLLYKNEEHPKIAYSLAVTDLFVEKALAYLEHHGGPYRTWGHINFFMAALAIFVGALIAGFQMLSQYLDPKLFVKFGIIITSEDIHIRNFRDLSDSHALWQYALMSFAKAFTAYGMIVLIAVAFWRQGKALLDQAERVSEKCHALRQGRLFVHLKFGKPVTIEEFEKAFNWNLSQENAFTTVSTEASAPWGAAFKALSDSLALTLKGKKDDGK